MGLAYVFLDYGSRVARIEGVQIERAVDGQDERLAVVHGFA
jgi:hypothetical protein